MQKMTLIFSPVPASHTRTAPVALLQLLANADQLATTRSQELCMSLAATPLALFHEFQVSGNRPQRVEPGIAHDSKVAEKSTLYYRGQSRERPLCFVNSRKE